jgi:ankyrin repeat protein
MKKIITLLLCIIFTHALAMEKPKPNPAQQKLLNASLLKATIDGDENVVISLVKSGADINTTDSDKNTPLHLATAWSHENIINFLLKQPGIKTDTKDNAGDTPLCNTITNGSALITKLLPHTKSSEHTAHNLMKNPLYRAASHENERSIKILLNHTLNSLDTLQLSQQLSHLYLERLPLDIIGMIKYYSSYYVFSDQEVLKVLNTPTICEAMKDIIRTELQSRCKRLE